MSHVMCSPVSDSWWVGGSYPNPWTTGVVWMDDVQCVGTEERLVDCPFAGFGASPCTYDYVIRVGCYTKDPDQLPGLDDID